MRPMLYTTLLRRVALVFGLAGACAGAAIGLGAGRIVPHAGDLLAAMDRDRGDVTGSIGGSRILPLTDEQRGHIFDGIMKLRDAPVADVPAPETVTAMPGSVALQELPTSVIEEIPLVQGYKFVKLDDRILLVSPVDRAVVAEMPRYHTVLD
jgi:Protein of unknown function (DUF1236)